MNVTALHWWWVNIGSGNIGLVPSGNKAITWANVDPDLCRHIASLGLNELRSHIYKTGTYSVNTVYILLFLQFTHLPMMFLSVD